MTAYTSRLLACICGVVAIVSAIVYFLFPWHARLDFDVLGVAWVLMNLPKLAAGGMFLLAVTGAAIYTVAAAVHDA